MTIRRVERSDWRDYFDRVSRTLPAANVDVEVDGLDLGAQIELDHVPLEGLTYDHRDDAFSIVTELMEHRISHPREIYVDEEHEELRYIEIVDHDDHKHIAKLTRALALPTAEKKRS